MVEAYPSSGSSVPTAYSKQLERLGVLCELSLPVTEATDNGLKVLEGLMVKCSCLGVPGC